MGLLLRVVVVVVVVVGLCSVPTGLLGLTHPSVKIEKYPPILSLKSKLPPYIFTISDNILIDCGLKNDGHINSFVLL